MKKTGIKKIIIWSLLLSFTISLPSLAYTLQGYFIPSPLEFIPHDRFSSSQRSNMSSCANMLNDEAGEIILSRSSSTHNDTRVGTSIDDNGQIEYNYYGYDDGDNYIYFLDYGEDHLALCYAVRSSNRTYLTEFDIVVSRYFAWNTTSTGFDFYSVILHELGHAAGLNHSSDHDAVMYPTFAPGERRRTLNDDDIAGMHDIYYWNW